MLDLELTPESKQIIERWGPDMSRKLKDVRRKWVAGMEGFMLGAAERSFVLQKQIGGRAWPVNSDAWKIRKVQLGARTAKTNIFTGAMMRSISSSKTSFIAKVGSAMGIAIYTQDRKDAALNRPFLPEEKYVSAWGKKLAEDQIKQVW